MVMKNTKLVNLLTFLVVFISLAFFSLPLMAGPLGGTQLALREINADDADAATNEPAPQKPKPQAAEIKPAATGEYPKSLEQEIQELREEIQRIRNENEARKILEVPEEEKSKSVEDILSAAGRQYTLLKKGTIGLSYTFNYSYFSGDVISEATTVERRANHNLTNTINADYALRDNLTISAGIPFVYKYNKVGTDASQEATDLGDVSLSCQYQPLKAGGKWPTTILSLGVSFPTGTSPYKIDPDNSMATGSGLYSFSGGVSLSKVLDPLVAFGNISYSYSLPEEGLSQRWGKKDILTKIEPGSVIGVAIGFGYALSYTASLNISAQYSYGFSNKYTINDSAEYSSGSSASSTFNIGTGWRITPTRAVYTGLGIGLTSNDSDLSFYIRLPFEF